MIGANFMKLGRAPATSVICIVMNVFFSANLPLFHQKTKKKEKNITILSKKVTIYLLITDFLYNFAAELKY